MVNLLEWDAAQRKILRRVKCSTKPSDGVSLDARGTRLAWAQKGAGVIIYDVRSGKALARDDQLKVKWLALSPDARMLALSQGSRVEIRSAVPFKKLFSIDGHKAEVTNLVWSTDGKMLASTASDGQLIITDLASRKNRQTIKKTEALYAVSFHPAGKRIAFGGHDRKIYQTDLTSGKERVLSQNQPYWITCLGYSPEGDVITAGDESCDVWTYEVKTAKLLSHTKHHVECWLNSVAWSPDNETFLLGCRPNSHAGKPAQYAALNYQEAAQFDDVQQVQRQMTALRTRATRELEGGAAKPLSDKLNALLKQRDTRLAAVLKQPAPQVAAASGPKAVVLVLLGEEQQGQVLAQGVGAMPAQQMAGAGGFAGGMAGDVVAAESQVAPAAPLNGVQSITRQAARPAVEDAELKKLDQQIAQLKSEISAKPGVKSMLTEMSRLKSEHQKRLESRAQSLGKSFNINQWKVSRKK